MFTPGINANQGCIFIRAHGHAPAFCANISYTVLHYRRHRWRHSWAEVHSIIEARPHMVHVASEPFPEATLVPWYLLHSQAEKPCSSLALVQPHWGEWRSQIMKELAVCLCDPLSNLLLALLVSHPFGVTCVTVFCLHGPTGEFSSYVATVVVKWHEQTWKHMYIISYTHRNWLWW